MGVESRYRYLWILNTHVLAGLVGDLDDLQHPGLLYPVAGLAQGNVSGYMNHTQVMVGPAINGVFLGLGVGSIDFRVAVKMGVAVGTLSVVMLQGLVHGLFI